MNYEKYRKPLNNKQKQHLKERKKKYYLKNKEKLDKKNKIYRKTKKGKEAHAKSTKRAYYKFPEKDKARNKLKYEIKHGRILKQPCIICGNIKSHGHHNDYKKPLNVIWLCDKHHKEIHKNQYVMEMP
jgi:hypothetical protein